MSGSSAERSAIRKEAARKWSVKHENSGGTGKKFLQYASAPGINEELPPPRPPRGHHSPKLDVMGGLRLNHLIHTSSKAQRDLAEMVKQGFLAETKRDEISRRIAAYDHKIVADTNVVLYALTEDPLSDCQQIVEMIENYEIGLCVVPAIIHEMQEVAVSPKFIAENAITPGAIARLNQLLTEIAIDVSAFPPNAEDIEPLVCDPTDTPFIVAMEKSRAQVLVTRDKHLLYDAAKILGGEFTIMRPREFLERIKKR